MKKSWGMLPKILSGEKTIESRWYATRRTPWGTVRAGDVVYFKNSGETVSLKAAVRGVKQIAGLTPRAVKGILLRYGAADGIGKDLLADFYRRFKNKKYCILVFLKGAKRVRPFAVDKRGFGMMSAWISVPRVRSLSRRSR